MRQFMLFLIICGLAIISSLFGGYVMACMWKWFVLTSFPTLPSIDYMHAVGLNIVISFPLSSLAMRINELRTTPKDEDAKLRWVRLYCEYILACGLALGLSLFWRQFIH